MTFSGKPKDVKLTGTPHSAKQKKCWFPIRLYRVRGASMFPLLQEGDIVCVTNALARSVKPGDVVVLLHPFERGRILIKKVGKCERDEIWVESTVAGTGADSHTFGAVAQSHILGKAVCILRKKVPFFIRLP